METAKAFRLEGHEDLDILDGEGRVLEVIQLKAYGTALSLSNLKPQKADSFFRRVLNRRADFPEALERIVSFGPYGPEMRAAWAGDPTYRARALEQFKAWHYTPAQAQELLTTVKLDTANEAELEATIFAILRETFTGCDPVSAFDLLHAWLFQAAEERATITQSQLQEQLIAVGRFLKDRDAYQAEWFTTVRPLADTAATGREELSEEFYQGVSARFEHVLADVDVVRPERLAALKTAFCNSRVVVVRGASGQGKSTLAYRFLRDHVPAASRFEVRLVQDRRHARSIAQALLGHLSAIGALSYIYIDVTPGDTAWTDLVQSLHEHPSARILVTIREEDWLRASISGADLRFEDMKLQLEEHEARSIHALLVERHPPPEHLDFEEVWARFGGGGPLLEFTYLVTHHDTLQARLEQQVRRLGEEVQRGGRPRAEVELLRRVAVASAYGARLDLSLLARELELSEPLLTVQRLEREYLIRPDAAGRLVEGLHPVRSEILVGLLTDHTFNPWVEVASRSLTQIVESDLGVFLLYAFSRHSEAHAKLRQALATLKPGSWEGVAQICRALMWWGLYSYVARNAAVLAEAKARYGSGWWVALRSDVGNVQEVAPGLITNPLEELDIIPAERKQALREFQARQSDPSEIFAAASQWLRDVPWQQLEAPASPEAWADVAEVIFRAARLGLPLSSLGVLLEAYATVLDELPLETAVDVAYACSFHTNAQVSGQMEHLRPKILDRIRREMRIVRLEDDGQQIKAHFVLIPRDSGTPTARETRGQHRPHDDAVRCARLLRRLLPDRRSYATQGYGHRFRMLPVDSDETVKNIQARYLPPAWATRLNNMFLSLANYRDRPATWEAHAREVLALRQELVRLLQMIQNTLIEYFHGREAKSPISAGRPEWNDYEATRARIASRAWLLPQTAVDEWGFSSEGNDQTSAENLYRQEHQVALIRHEPYVKLVSNYERSLSNFLQQVITPLLVQPLLARGNTLQTEMARAALRKQGRQDLDTNLPMSNLSDALEKLPALRREFQARLARFLDASELAALEAREDETLNAVLALWLLFMTAPERSDVRHPLRLAQTRLEKALDLIRHNLRSGFTALAEKQATARILTGDASWNQGPALWLLLDMSSPLTLHSAYAALLAILHSALTRDKIGHPLLHVVRTAWQHIVIIPTIRGRAIAPTAWVHNPLTLILNRPEDLGWRNQVFHPIPEETWCHLKIECWTQPRISWAEDFNTALGRFGLLLDETAHVAEAFEGPEVDALGLAVQKEFAHVQSKRMSEAIERLIETMMRISHFLTMLSPGELKARPHLAVVIESVQTIAEAFQGIETAGPAELQRLHDGYKDILIAGEIARLHWLADVLEQGA